MASCYKYFPNCSHKKGKSIADSAVFPFSFIFLFFSSQFSFLFSFCLAVFGLGALPFRQYFYRALRIACTPLFFLFPIPFLKHPAPSVLAVAPGCCFIIFLRLPPVFFFFLSLVRGDFLCLCCLRGTYPYTHTHSHS